MGLGDYWIQTNDNKRMNLFSIRELKISDVKNNTSFFKLFNIFDTKKADGSSGSDQILGREELLSLCFSVAETARNNGSSIFDKKFAEKYVNQIKLPNGKTLKELNVDANELIDFLTFVVDDPKEDKSFDKLTPEQKKQLTDISDNPEYHNLSSIQKNFIFEAIKSNLSVSSAVEYIKNIPLKNFNEATLDTFKKALADKDFDIDMETGLALSVLNEEQYQTTKNIFMTQQRQDPFDLKTIAEIAQNIKSSDLEKFSHYVSAKTEPHNINLNATTIEFLMKMEDSDRDKFFNIIKDKNISPKYYSKIAQLTPIYEHLPKNFITEYPDFTVVMNSINGTVGFSPSQDSNERYYYSKEDGLYEIRKTENNTETVVNNKTNTVDRIVHKTIPGYDKIVESEVIEQYDSINMPDIKNWQTGNLLKKTVRKLSDIEGVYNVSETNAKGKQKLIEFGSKDKKGNVYVEKNYTSPEGVKTQYAYERTVDNKVIVDYKISRINPETKKTEILLDRHQTVEHKGDGLVVTSVNGNVYEAQFNDNKLVIFDKTNNEKREFYLGKAFIDSGIDIIMNILHNVPANELMVMKKLPISAIYYNDTNDERINNNARWSETGKFIEMGNEARIKTLNMARHSNAILNIMLPTFLHEFGHYIELDANSGLCSTISQNQDLMNIFKEEFEKFISESNGVQQEYISYFIDSVSASSERNAQERVAEANTILNSLPSEQYANRASYLQQYFPRTIAKIAELIDGVLK